MLHKNAEEFDITPQERTAAMTHVANLDHYKFPMSQFAMPRIHIFPPEDGETTVLLIWGLPCCGIDLALECPASFTIEQLGQFIAKAIELREWARKEHFSVCAVPKEPGIKQNSDVGPWEAASLR